MSQIEIWNLIISSISTLLSGIAILLYIVLWYRERSHNNYDVFDSTYLEILKTGIEFPELRDIEYVSGYKSLGPIDKSRYETYAYICWNFCETIYDKVDKDLMKTWSVVIDAEKTLHIEWLQQPENQVKFKREFIDYILNNKH